MTYCHEFVEIHCPYDSVFDLFSDPRRLPDWAIEYCQGISAVEGGYLAKTVEGERCFNTRADRATGIADACSGASHDDLSDVLHIRVIPASDAVTLVEFVYSPPGPVPLEVVELMKTGLRKEVAHAKQLLEVNANGG